MWHNQSTISSFLGRFEGSVENPITIEEDEGFSEPRTPVIESPRQPRAMKARPDLRFIENLQKSSAAQQLFGL